MRKELVKEFMEELIDEKVTGLTHITVGGVESINEFVDNLDDIIEDIKEKIDEAYKTDDFAKIDELLKDMDETRDTARGIKAACLEEMENVIEGVINLAKGNKNEIIEVTLEIAKRKSGIIKETIAVACVNLS